MIFGQIKGNDDKYHVYKSLDRNYSFLTSVLTVLTHWRPFIIKTFSMFGKGIKL